MSLTPMQKVITINSYYQNITQVNGFDIENPDNARQNNYAWSMEELGQYIYVGTGRNIVYQPLSILEIFGIELPPILAPENPDNNAEIWRYNKNGCGEWERVYKAPPELAIMGFRFMKRYKDSTGVTGLYAGAFTITSESYLLWSSNGTDWEFINQGIPDGFSTRTMIEHAGKLYMAATKTLDESQQTYLYSSSNPRSGWTQITMPAGGPTGEIQSMASFKNHLYIGTAPTGGFAVWRTIGVEPDSAWRLVVDKGAGDALNELPLSMEVFKNHVYVGTGIWVGVVSVDPDKLLVPPKGFDLIRIDDDDHWWVIAGSEPLIPTQPTTGSRNVGEYASGFGNMFNAYCWQIKSYNGQLYIGTWDTLILVTTIIEALLGAEPADAELQNISIPVGNGVQINLANINTMLTQMLSIGNFNFLEWLRSFLESLKLYPESYGFDFLRSHDGKHYCYISVNGLDNEYNYGLRTTLVSKDGSLYIGTANPFEGCEVWKLTNDD